MSWENYFAKGFGGTKDGSTTMTTKCLDCKKDAKWIRYTQFSGNHPFCKRHAKEQKDFKKNDSYAYWSKI